MIARSVVVLLVILCAAVSMNIHHRNCYAADKHCMVIKNHLDAIKNLCITRFGEDREKAIIGAKSKLLQELRALDYSLSQEVSALIEGYVTAATLGYDRMRKRGDVKLVKKAQGIRATLRSWCPWD